ncbi:MAG: SMP-30/gluconolactonase/LRE family protein [Chitinophagaceae bacterium]|nr:SMP-30/gluconolactonase/LRE family protein [Chitinophagaceae bacterium]
MKKLVFVPLFSLSLTALYAQQHQLIKKWESDTVLKVSESVLFDAKNNVLYVTNIDGTEPWGKDGKGSVGKLGTEGKIINAEWVTGLDAPKGMGLYKGKLYVADMENLVVIDITKGSIEKKIAVEGAQGLNDVSIDKNGVVYVSDSRAKRLYRVINEKTELFLDNLKGPNGVLVRGEDLYLLDAGGMYKVEKDKTLTKITDGMDGGTDGIENVAGNDFIISCWAGVIWYVNADGTKEKLLDTREEKRNTADIGWDVKTRTVYVPTFWKNSVVAYEVK